MLIGVPKEIFPGERRVALVPGVIPNLTKAGCEVAIEAGAGMAAGYPDEAYAEKGAKVLADRAEVFRTADVIVQVLCYGSNDQTGRADLPLFRRGQVLIGFLRPLGSLEVIQQIAATGVTSFSVELMPRTTRPGYGRALFHGYRLRLSCRRARRRHSASPFSDAHHGGRHHHSGARFRCRSGSGRASGHCHRAEIGCGGFSLRSATGSERAGAKSRWTLRRATA